MPKVAVGSALQAKTGTPVVVLRVEGTAYFTLEQAAELVREVEHARERARFMAAAEQRRKRTEHVFKHGGGK